MVKVSVTYNGRPFDPERFKRDVMDHAMKLADAKVQENVRGLRCPVHFQTPAVSRTATGWSIQSCCKTMKEAVERRLKH